MKVTRKDLDSSQVELTIEVPIEDITPHLETAAKKISKDAKIDGFRPGKVPYEVLKEKVGEEAILQEAAEEVINNTYVKALDKEKITKVIAQPEIKITEIKPGKPMVYTAIVSLLPSVKVCDLKTVKVSKKKAEINKDKIEHTLTDLRKMRASEKLVDRAAKDGDKVEVDFDVYLDGVVIEGGSAKKQPIILGEGNFIPGFEENVIDMKKEDRKEFKLKFPKDYFQKNLAGKECDFKIKLVSVNEVVLPEINDEFAKGLGQFKDVADMKTKIEENLVKEAEQKESQRLQAAILEGIIEKSEFGKLPAVLIDSEKERMIQEIKQDLESQGLNFEKYLEHLKKSEDDLKEGFTKQADKRAKSALLTRQVALDEKIKVEDKEIDDEVKKTLEMYKTQPEMTEQFKSPGYKDYLAKVMINQKVLKFLEKKVKIEEAK